MTAHALEWRLGLPRLKYKPEHLKYYVLMAALAALLFILIEQGLRDGILFDEVHSEGGHDDWDAEFEAEYGNDSIDELKEELDDVVDWQIPNASGEERERLEALRDWINSRLPQGLRR